MRNTILKLAIWINRSLSKKPKIAKALASIMPPNRLLYGSSYRKWYNSINFNAPIEEERILAITNYAYSNAKHYSSLNVDLPIISLNDFRNRIPFCDKEIIVNKGENLLTKQFNYSDYEIVTTGSTSGLPTTFYLPKKRYQKEYAFYHRIWSQFGYENQLRGVIRNEKLQENQHYKLNPVTKELIFDGFNSTDSYYQIIFKTLKDFKIEYLQCYASSAYNFAVAAQKHNWDITFIKAIFLSSENYMPHQRELLKNTLGLNVVSVYGHSEKLIMAVDFNGNGFYQVINNYGFLELIDEDGNLIQETGITGEIVGTTLDNYGQPLIRYKTGDLSSYSVYVKNGKRVLDGIQGRTFFKIYNKDNTFVTPTALNMHNDIYLHINGYQYYQPIKGELHIKIIPKESFTVTHENLLISHFSKRLAKDTLVVLKKVTQLTKGVNGKVQIFISNIKEDKLI